MSFGKYKIEYRENGTVHSRQVYVFDIEMFIKNWKARISTIEILKYESM